MKRKFALFLALMLLFLSGCGSTSASVATEAPSSAPSVTEESPVETTPEEAPAQVDVAPAGDEEILLEEATEGVDESVLPENYPMICEDGSITLTLLNEINSQVTDIVTDYNELQIYQELSARTGINLEWELYSGTAMQTQFSLLIAAGDLPDICCVAQYYTDGIASAVENEIFVDLAPYLADYAPHYKSITEQDGIRQLVYDEYGELICFHEIGQKELTPNTGMLIRGDWLEEQGLELPITYEQYESTLLQLKDAYDLEAPIVHTSAPMAAMAATNELYLSSGKNVKTDFSLDADGNLIFGPVEDSYREWLQIMRRWYDEGLIYRDFYSVDAGSAMSLPIEYVSLEKSACMHNYCEFVAMISFDDPDARLDAGYLPRDTEDQQVHLTTGIDARFKSNTAWAFSTNATMEEIQAGCLMLNYLYTDEGALLANWGVEGTAFEYQEDGTPWFTDLVLNNPDGLNQTQAEIMYLGCGVPTYSDYTKYNIAGITKYAHWVEVWGTADNTYALPAFSLNVEETEAYAAVATDVQTYLSEVVVKFFIGDLDINDDVVWQEHIDKLYQLGLQDMYDSYQSALNRYNGI